MWFHKISVIISVAIAVVALGFALLFSCINKEFATDIFINIFSGGLLSAAISIIGYFHERKRTLEDFWTHGHKAINNINRFEWDGDINRSMDIVLSMNDFDNSAFDSAFGNMSFIFHDKKTKKCIYTKIYKPILDIRDAIPRAAFHFKEYKKAANGNSVMMKQFIKELDSLIMETKRSTLQHEDGTTTDCTGRYNKIVSAVKDEFNGRYYKIMYPCTKREEA
ncbi:MAG: hypothetical protein ACOX88_02180 [Christensenellales bacterium]|jgi:hypothetical protein